MDICQTEKALQSCCKKLLELQLYDFDEFPNINAGQYGIGISRAVAGTLMKSGTPRPKNAILFIMECQDSRNIHDCIDHFVMKFIQQEFSPDLVKSLGCKQAFIRFRLPTTCGLELQDFTISLEVMKVLHDRDIHLDFWFLR